MPFDSAVYRVHDDTDLYVPKLRCFSEILRSDERLFAIDHDAFHVEAGAREITARHATGIVKHLRGPRSGHLFRRKRRRTAATARLCAPCYPRHGAHRDRGGRGQIGHLSHALGEDSENLATLLNGVSDYQNPMLSLREQLAEDDPGVTRGAGDIGAARDQHDLTAMDLRPPLCRDSIEQQGGIFWVEASREQRRQFSFGKLPGRFGLFAAMPLPDVDTSLKEIAYALDTLRADGIGLMTSYGDKWPGDPAFEQILEELNRRKAVVYFHPPTANCCGNLIPGVAPATIEWPVDTARAILSLFYRGSLLRHPDIRFNFSHAGGALPALSGRIANFVDRDKNAAKYAPHGAVAEFNKLYYDTANASAAPSMTALMAIAPTSQIVFGSDYPYFSLEENVEGLATFPRALHRCHAPPIGCRPACGRLSVEPQVYPAR
jgi:hypothetical protein